MIGVLDYGVGNLASVINMFKKVGVNACLVKSEVELMQVEKCILPGVGAFDHGISKLKQADYFQLLEQRVLQESMPILGICLGMQLLFEASEEGELSGLGWLSGKVKRFHFSDPAYKVPHMGWNRVRPTRENSLLDKSSDELRFYFVHSYYVCPSDPSVILATCDYGGEFTAAVNYQNIYGMQFHPEKSHKFGMEVFKKFATLETVSC